ncbi:MAG: 50S ribosomal protein L24 [Actinobacteria bacterium]|nr:MAG: 50S ribosomal protein L24 [Actinomycetota bacterium]
MRIRRDDEVVVISGKDKGKTGRVLRVEPVKRRVYVEGLNIVKRHQRPSALNPNAQAGVIEREGPIHVSNVALVDPKTKKPTRLGTTTTTDGKKARVARRSGTQID